MRQLEKFLHDGNQNVRAYADPGLRLITALKPVAQRRFYRLPIGKLLLVAISCSFLSVASAATRPDADDYPPKDTPEASMLRGDIVFNNYCALCHGVNADGKGRAARIYTPKPANLRTSMKNDAYKEMIIRKGGKAMARSTFMPPWGDELTDEQITDVVFYLRSIAPKNAPK